jgi:hypothetical protein
MSAEYSRRPQSVSNINAWQCDMWCVGWSLAVPLVSGQPAEYLYPVESIGVNGLHSVVLAPSVVRIEMPRKARTYEVLITQHGPQSTQ